MVKFLMVAAVMIFALERTPESRAQVMLDVSKVTCDQFVGYKITDPQNIAIWLSGYYNGMRGNTVVDTQGLDANTLCQLLNMCKTDLGPVRFRTN